MLRSTEKLLDIKREKGWSWKHICEQIGGVSPVLITGAILGHHEADQAAGREGRRAVRPDQDREAMLNEVPMRGAGTPMPPSDPLIYRFYELVMINGPAWKALIEEEFGDGIMSAIDFDMAIERQPDPKGDRVKITMSGKFLPFKYYGATGNAPHMGIRRSELLRSARLKLPISPPSCPALCRASTSFFADQKQDVDGLD